MSQFWINFTFVIGSFVIYTAIAVWARAKSTREFYIAGGEVNPVMNGMATAADWLSAASFISVAGLISVGYVNSSFIMGWTGGYVLLATLLAPYMRRFGAYTVPDFVGKRHGTKTARVVAVGCLLIISLTYVIGQMTGAGVAFSRFLEVRSADFFGGGVFLRRAGWHEGRDLHPGGAVHRADFGVHHSGGLPVADDDRPHPAANGLVW